MDALPHTYHEGRPCGKFGLIPPSGLGGDIVMDRWTDDGRMDGRTHGKIMLLSHFLTTRGSDVTSLVTFCRVV